MPSTTTKSSKKSSKSSTSATVEKKPAAPDARLWTSLNPPLSPWLLEALSCLGFNKMTPVQTGTIPLFLGNKDVVVEAVTGSGKTLAYLIPVIERLLRQEERKHYVMGIVVAPTRELASQIFTVLKSLLEFHPPSSAFLSKDPSSNIPSLEPKIAPMLLLGGGQSAAADLKIFLRESPNLLIGTPGRLNDLLASPYVHCTDSSFEALVLDEADRLLDLGFEDVLSKILARLPKQRRTGLFSATVTDAVVGSLVRAGLRNPVKIAVKVRTGAGEVVEEKRTPASLKMAYLEASHRDRLIYLRRLLLEDEIIKPQKSIVFFSTCAEADYFSTLFEKSGLLPKSSLTSISLHGKLAPNIRTKNFTKFTEATDQVVLFTTDLAARGLDIPQVDLVVQYDAPTDPKTFLHRAGRAGRAGRRGLAVLFLSPGKECEYVDFLAVRKTPVAPLSGDVAAPVEEGEVESAVEKMREVVMKDRMLFEKGMKAFVSYVRAYGKHQTSSIFRVQDIDWKDLALSFGLVRMPAMPELKKLDIKVDLGLPAIDTSSIPYASAHLEAQRLAQLANPAPPSKDDKSKSKGKKRKQTEAWSEKKANKETREERRERKKIRREKEKLAKMNDEEKAREAEWRALAEEVKKSRKERKGKKEEGEGLEGL